MSELLPIPLSLSNPPIRLRFDESASPERRLGRYEGAVDITVISLRAWANSYRSLGTLSDEMLALADRLEKLDDDA